MVKKRHQHRFFATSTFFVLSGFLLTHVYFNQNQMREPASSFWIKRFCNLYPVHIVALISSVLVLILMHRLSVLPDGPGASPRFVVYDTHELIADRSLLEHYMDNSELMINSVLQLFMLQAWNPLYLTFNAPLWSLSTLFFSTLCFLLSLPGY
ncbi:acyltransferase family protein [Erwinia aphidicola]